MKLQLKYMMMAATAAVLSMGAVSCDQESVDDIEGIYEAPTTLKTTGATLIEKTKSGNIRTFILNLSNSNNIDMKLAVVSNKYYIESGNYMPAPLSGIKNGTIASELSSINGSAVVEGTLALVQNGDNYTINKSVLFTADGKAYKFDGEFVLVCEPDDPTALTLKTNDAWGNDLVGVDNGNGTYTVTFTTGGYTEEVDWTTYQTIYTGEGNDLQIIFNLPDGKLHEGTYKPGEGYVAGYSFMNDAYEAWGIPAFEDYAGSIWYSIANGARTTESLITIGDIVVTKNGPQYTILLDQGKGGVYAEFKGAIASLDPDGGGGATITNMSSCLGVANYAALGWTGLIDIQLGNGTLVGTYNEATYTTTYSGSGDFLQIEVYSEQGVGTLARGTYEIADDATFGPMKFKVGAVGMYGDGGTFVKPYTDGEAGEAKFITEGTLTIEGEGESTSITLSTPDATYMFTGNIGI